MWSRGWLRPLKRTEKVTCHPTRSLHAPDKGIPLRSDVSLHVDACAIPLTPTWSVNDLLASYPTPTISHITLNRLHELSALVPPAETTSDYDRTKKELEHLIRLVGAVKLLKTESEDRVPDGRVWNGSTGITTDGDWEGKKREGGVSGRSLLEHAKNTKNGMYVVNADRRPS
jgi:hypothetical protein